MSLLLGSYNMHLGYSCETLIRVFFCVAGLLMLGSWLWLNSSVLRCGLHAV